MLSRLFSIDTVVWDIALLFIAATWLGFFIFGKKFGAEKEYERIAGRPLKIGDPVPKWVAGELWQAIAVVPIWGERTGRSGKMIFICRSIVATGNPQRLILEVLPDQRIPAKGETFNISPKGKIEFGLQPNV